MSTYPSLVGTVYEEIHTHIYVSTYIGILAIYISLYTAYVNNNKETYIKNNIKKYVYMFLYILYIAHQRWMCIYIHIHTYVQKFRSMRIDLCTYSPYSTEVVTMVHF